MLRPQPMRRPWMTPGFNPGIPGDDSDHLSDDVVAMFRESFDEDGLDFLKRGPRTAQERLAYAQRVRPDAHLTAPPASTHMQRRFADHGVIDRERYFVGPNGFAYLRSDDSAEVGPAVTRRSFESAVGGFAPVSFEQAVANLGISSTIKPGEPSGDDGISLHVDGQSAPSPMHLTQVAQPHIDDIEKRYRAYVDYGRRGYNMAADALEHFLNGSGAATRLDPSWLRTHSSVRQAETEVLWHFANWISGYQRSNTASEVISQDLRDLPEGQTFQATSNWTSSFTPDFLSRAERDAFATVGETNLTGTGSFTFRREGDRIHFAGPIRMAIDDAYDWERGELGLVPRPDEMPPFFELSFDDDAIALEEAGRAKPFKLYSSWWKNLRGPLIVRDGRLVLETIEWQDRQR